MNEGRQRPERSRRPFSFLAVTVPLLLANPAASGQLASEAVCVEGPADACRHILTATRDFAAMLASGDPAPVLTHFAADAQITLSSGRRLDRAAMVAGIRGGPRAGRARLDGAKVRITGDVAVVTWEESWSPGQRPGGLMVGTDVWQRRREGWRVVASAEVRPETPIPTP